MSDGEVQRQAPGVRIGEAERRRAIDRLRTSTGEGLIDLDEFAERVEHVLAATTDAELAPVLADLPSDRAAAPTPASPAESSRVPARLGP